LSSGGRIPTVARCRAEPESGMASDIRPAHGVLLVLAAAVLWGTTGTAQSFAGDGLSSAWVGALRLAVAAVFFGAWLAMAGRARGPEPAPPAWSWGGVFAAAACMAVYNLAFFAGVRATGVAVGTAVALGSGPVWAGLIEAIWQRRRPTAAWWAGTGVAVVGVALLVTGPGRGGEAGAWGVVLCLLAGLSYALYALLNKSLVASAPAAPVTAAVFAVAAVLALPPAALIAGPPLLQARDAAVLLWLGVMSTGVAYLLLSHALRHLAGSTAVTLALAEPVTAFALAVVVVGEQPERAAWVGLALVVAGLAIVVRREVAPAPGRQGHAG
jgi:DME family drug/metabolite transporter